MNTRVVSDVQRSFEEIKAVFFLFRLLHEFVSVLICALHKSSAPSTPLLTQYVLTSLLLLGRCLL